jgi:hypothetical protein
MKTCSVALGIIVIALVVGVSVTSHTQTAKERVIERMPVEKNEPVEIIDTRVDGQSITLGQKFKANDDWIKTLVFTVKNKSDKRILFTSIDLFLPRHEGSNPMFDLFYGNWGLQNRRPTSGEQSIGIAPGETVEIGLSAQRLVGFTSFLKDSHVSQSIEKIDVRFGSVIVEDDTMWSRGAYFHRDPSNPARWNNASP